jgi:hypothetical protein
MRMESYMKNFVVTKYGGKLYIIMRTGHVLWVTTRNRGY